MSLRKKTLSIVIIVFFILILMVYGISKFILLRNLEKIEINEISVNFIFISFIIVCFISGVMILLLLEKFIISRISNINKCITDITETGKSGKLPVLGNDEIASLAIKINKMLEALEESNEALTRQVMDSITAQIAVLDKDGTITFVNEAWDKFTRHIKKYKGIKSDIGLNYINIWRSETGALVYEEPEILKGFESVLQGEMDQFYYEYPCRLFSYTRWFYVTVTPLPGKFGAAVVSRIDITERKMAEEEAKKLVAAIDQAGECMVITDARGVIEYANTAFESITGYQREDVVGKSFRAIESNKENEEYYPKIWNKLCEGNIWKGQLSEKKKDGTPLQLEITISSIRSKFDLITHFVAVTYDVTKQFLMEKQLRQSQKLEAIGILAGGIAHDFNNILASIIGYTEMSLLETTQDTKLWNNLEHILKAGDRARDLIYQILTFTRQTEQEKNPIELKPIIKETLKLIRASLPTTIEISQKLDAHHDTILADGTQMHQVLMNLCTNAGHAMKDSGGIIEVSLMEIDIAEGIHNSDLKPGAYLRLTIRDTGHGIDSDIIDKIFDPFFTTKDPGEGTGMGLSVVHGIIKAHGGAISVNSELYKGTVFHIFLPRIDMVPRQKAGTTGPLPSGKAKILFVDDEEDIVEMEEMMLTYLGYEVTATTESLEALEIFKNDPDKFDLVITDYTMPDMTGIELAKELSSIKPKIRIILCTGFNDTRTQEKVKTTSIREIMIKPVTMQIVAETVQRVLNVRNV
jgi:PAS domain S-box-containing protein